MAQITVKDAAGATQTVAKLANTGSLAGAESMSVVGASTSTSTNATTTAYAAITLVNSDNCHALRNRAVGDGRVNGQTSFNRREAFLLYNAEAVPPNAQTTNCSFENNLHAWSGPGGSLTAAYAPEAGSNGNFLSGMTSLGTPDEAMELAEWALWRAKVAAAGVRLGSTLAV